MLKGRGNRQKIIRKVLSKRTVQCPPHRRCRLLSLPQKHPQTSPPTQFQRPISCFFVEQSPNPLDLNDNDNPSSIFYCLENYSHVHISMYYPSRTSVRRVSQFQPPLRPNFSYRTFSIQGILQSWLHHFDGSLCIATRHSLV